MNKNIEKGIRRAPLLNEPTNAIQSLIAFNLFLKNLFNTPQCRDIAAKDHQRRITVPDLAPNFYGQRKVCSVSALRLHLERIFRDS